MLFCTAVMTFGFCKYSKVSKVKEKDPMLKISKSLILSSNTNKDGTNTSSIIHTKYGYDSFLRYLNGLLHHMNFIRVEIQ